MKRMVVLNSRKKTHFFGLGTLYASLGLLLAGSGLQMTFLTLRAREESFSPFQIGLMGSFYFAGYLIGCRHIPRALAGIVHIRAFAGLASIVTVIGLLYPSLVYPPVWMFLRLATGFCMAGLYVVVESWVNHIAINENRGQVISQYRLVDIGANILGQSVLFMSPIDDQFFFTAFVIAMALSIVPVTLTRTVSPEGFALKAPQIRKIWKQSPFPVLGCFAIGFANSSLWALSPLFVRSQVVDADAVPFFFIVYLIGGFLSQRVIGPYSDGRDRRTIMILASCMTAGLTFSLSYLGYLVPALFWGLVFLYGAFCIPLYSLCIALANDQVRDGDYVSTSSALLFTYGLGAIQGPVLVGFMIQSTGDQSLFYFVSAIFACFSFFGLYRLTRRPAVPPPLQTAFVDVPSETGPGVFEMVDPQPISSESVEKHRTRGGELG